MVFLRSCAINTPVGLTLSLEEEMFTSAARKTSKDYATRSLDFGPAKAENMKSDKIKL